MSFSSEEKKILAAANQYTEDTVIGMGAIQGASAQVANKVETDEKTTWDWKWVDENGVSHTTPMEVKNGAKGDKGDDGQGIPEGGTTGQALVKKSNADGDVEWKDVEGGGTEQIQSDWAQTDDTKKDYIKHKPENLVQDASYVHTDNNYDATAKGIVDGVTAALAGKVDKETGKSLIDLTTVVDGASYDSTNHLILFKHGSTTLFSLDAAAFVKDGMVDTVEITGGNLVITFNTDAGKQDISIPITDIFDPANYYDKDDVDGLLADKADATDVASDIQDVYEVMGKNGAKNLNSYPYYDTTRTQNGITFTDNGDGTITVDGTASGDAYFTCHARTDGQKSPLVLSNGRYILSGSPSGASVSGAYLKCGRTYNGTYSELGAESGSGATITLAGDDYGEDSVRLQIQIAVKSGTVVNNLVFKPMLRLAEDTDNTYVPYAPTNAKLNEEKVSYDDASESVQKNLLKYPYHETTVERNGITWTDLGDGCIKANGTATDNSSFTFSLNETKLPAGAYLFTTNTATSGIADSILNDDSGNRIARGNSDLTTTTPSNTNKFVLTRDMSVNGFLRVFSGQTVSNLIFKPMIRKATIKDDTWVPYIPNNTELVSWKANGILGAKNLIPYPYNQTSATHRGITFTSDSEGVVTFSGTGTDGNPAQLLLTAHTAFKLKKGTYTLSGGSSKYGGMSIFFYNEDGTNYSGSYSGLMKNSSNNVYIMTTQNGAQINASNLYGYDKTFTINSDAWVDIACRSVTTAISEAVSGTIYPMLRLASDPDDTYQPYAMTNRELTNRVIQSVVSVDRDTTTTNSGTIKLYRYGNLRILTGNFNPSVAGTSATNTHIADLPLATDYPTYSVISVCGRGETDSSATAKIGNLNIGTDGVIKYQGQATGENMFFNISWVVG